jgi:hypothetical protein
MPAIPAALRELSETAPLYVETAISREVRWSPETGHLSKLPKPRARKSTTKPTPKSKPKPPVAPEKDAELTEPAEPTKPGKGAAE